MKRTFIFLILVILLLAACQVAPSTPAPTTAPTATPRPPAVAPTAPPAPTKSAKIDIRATVAALAESAQFNPATPAPDATKNVQPHDYVGMFELGWRIVRDNYVRDNYNGVDWDAIHDQYRPRAEAVTDQKAFWNMMEDMIAELHDSHSRFVRPDRFGAEFDIKISNPSSSGQAWTAMTIWPAREDERLMIWDVCDVGPAASAGLRRGDVILAINGTPIERGEKGFEQGDYRAAIVGSGKVTLTVLQGPGAKPKDITLRYGGGSGCDGWSYSLLSKTPKIGYIRIPDFGGDADTNTLDLIQRLEKEGPLDGLVLDVRHNPGGNSDSTIALFTTGIFGKIGSLRQGATRTIYRIRGPVKWNESTPMAVLTDGSSHSAAEYFATAMQQSGRAVLVGMPTAGNTEGINSWNLPDGSVIRLAWMTLVLPDGNTLEGVGVQPDVRVPLGDWGLRQDPDVQLQAAYEAVLGEIQ
ncbi:MAG: PDZ domain-containing protein [Chloroflexi bacterium]|nr:PDZ domain-containing protein [Chloroflexota bacterium]